MRGTNRLVENLMAITQPSLSQGENANTGRGRLLATDNADFEYCDYSVVQLTWTCSASNSTVHPSRAIQGETVSLSSTYQGSVVIQFESSDETKLPQYLQSAATINRALLTADGTITSTLTSALLNDGQGFSVTLTLSETSVTLTDIQETQFNFALQSTVNAQTSLPAQKNVP